MSAAHDVIVCVPTYNQSAYVAEAVRSALGQTWPVRSVYVSDDASTDQTVEVMTALAAAEPRVRYVRHEQNVGIAANNTRLMQEVDSEFIVRLDSDDALLPEYVETLLPMMRANPRAGYGHVAINRVDQTGKPIATAFLHRPGGYQDADTALRAAVRGYRVAANIVMYRTAALRELNFFAGRPEFVEDYDLAVAMAAAGWGNVYADRVLARYRVWTDAAGVRPRRKHLELDGLRQIFDATLTPAFEQRGWDSTPLRRQRRHLALAHANACFLPQFTPDDRVRLIELLRRLGPSRALEIKLKLLRHGLAPALEAAYKFKGRVKLRIKAMLAGRRAAGRAS